jgi:two-component system osmolarity sensor histidine kinase EnvZ
VLPRSFFGRNLLLLMALFAFGLGSGALALRQWVQKPRITELAELVARQARLAQLALEVIPREHRESVRPWLGSRSRIQVLPVTAYTPPAISAYPSPAQQFMEDLRSRLPDALDVRWAPAHRGTVWVQMPVAADRYWLIETGVYLEATVSAWGIGILALVSVLSILGAVHIQARINRPLARLVEAARTLGSNRRMVALDEKGPQEFALVSRAFNHMTACLAKADTERAVLLAGVSHDLRTPLAKMRLAIEMLGQGSDPELVESMLRSVREMESATGQFLYYARDQDRRDFVEAKLNDLVLESVESHRGGSRAILFHPSEECSVALHRESISRALDNLIENALRYSDAEIEVVVRHGNGRAQVSVLDRGPGIPTSEVEALKMPFARGNSSLGKSGAGLGLAIVERIAAAHEARFDLLPRDGGGTEARLELPLGTREIAEDAGLKRTIDRVSEHSSRSVELTTIWLRILGATLRVRPPSRSRSTAARPP